MDATINYQDINTLLNISNTLKKFDYFLVHLRFTLERKFNHFNIEKELDIQKNEYVLKLNIENLKLKIGFTWELEDVYFGTLISIPRENGEQFSAIKDMLFGKKWGFSKKEKSILMMSQNRLIDYLISHQGIDVERESIMGRFIENIDETIFFVKQLNLVAEK